MPRWQLRMEGQMMKAGGKALTTKQHSLLLDDRAKGMTMASLATTYRIGVGTVKSIVYGWTYKTEFFIWKHKHLDAPSLTQQAKRGGGFRDTGKDLSWVCHRCRYRNDVPDRRCLVCHRQTYTKSLEVALRRVRKAIENA